MCVTQGRKTQLEEGTDRLKLWFLYAGSDEDKDDDKDKSGRRLVRAAAGGLAMLTDEKPACVRLSETVSGDGVRARIHVTQVSKWIDCLKDMARRGDPEAHFRSMLTIENMMRNDYDVCAKMCQSELLEMIIAISKLDEPKRARSREIAVRCLQVRACHLCLPICPKMRRLPNSISSSCRRRVNSMNDVHTRAR
jgi:hypothetical protein